MDFKNIGVSVFVVLIGIVAWVTLLNQFNDDYGTSGGSQFNATLSRVDDLTGEAEDLQIGLANSTGSGSGTSTGTGLDDLVSKGLSGLTKIPVLLGIIPAMMRDMLSLADIEGVYADILVAIFNIAFAITFIYVLILGVRRL